MKLFDVEEFDQGAGDANQIGETGKFDRGFGSTLRRSPDS